MKFLTLALLLLYPLGVGFSPMKATHLRCEYLINPIGIGTLTPRLSWWDESPERGAAQSAYQILVSSSRQKLDRNEGDLWDSGKAAGDQSIQVEYGGQALTSREQAFWKVRVWDRSGNASAYSQSATFEIGLLQPGDWKATWIGDPAAAVDRPDAAPYIRKAFEITNPVAEARVYASAQGLYELYVNGHRVGEDKFDPGFSDYHKRILYQTFDVTPLLRRGKNALGAILGDGWYVGHVGGWDRQQYGKQPMGLVQLEVTYRDGSRETVASDDSWKVQTGPILSDDFMRGENYDARKELGDWSSASCDDTSWRNASTGPVLLTAPLAANCSESVKQWNELHPKSITEPTAGAFVVDLGQNMVGVARLKVEGQAGQQVTLRYAEMLNPDGTIYTKNLRTATSTDTYILKGGGEEVYEPHFTFHGFRYVEVTGYPGQLTNDSITGIVLGSATPNAGSFECSNPMVNQLWHNIYWGQRGNYLSIPTDCPQRDERLGWMGDAEIFVKTATYNCDIAPFMTKWLGDVRDGQLAEGAFADVSPRVSAFNGAMGAPGWGDAGVIVPFTIYQVYDDKRLLAESYDSMHRWVDLIHDSNPDLLWKNNRGNDYGDWLSIKADTPKELLATAFWAHSTDLVAQSAAILGKDEDAARYRHLYQGICDAFTRAYVSADGTIEGDTQTGYLVALRFGLLPPDMRPLATKHLIDNIVEKRNTHLSTGFLGAGYLNPVLSATGNDDVAYKLLLTDTFPSWGYPIKNGATTIWERWDGWTKEHGFQDPGMNSFNHYAFGSVGEWLYGTVAGIRLLPDHPAYKRFAIHPTVGGNLTHVSCSFESMYGKIESSWKKDGGAFELNVTVPANTAAEVYVPCDSKDQVTEGGKPASLADGVQFLRMEGNEAVFEVGSGSYRFQSH